MVNPRTGLREEGRMKSRDAELRTWPSWPAAFNQVPKWAFHDPDLFELEIERIFKGPIWHPVAHDAELPNPGDFKTVTVGRTPLLVQRGPDGAVRVFHNACTHRATKLAMRFLGQRTDIECPYHRWLFDLEGNLRACPGEADFPPEFRRADYNLRRVPTATYYGLIFASLHASPPPLAQWLGDVATPVRETMGSDGRLKLLGYQKVLYQSNWKVYIDNDAFHAPLLHTAFRLLGWQGGGGRQLRLDTGNMVIETVVPVQKDSGLLRDPSVIGYRGGATPRNKPARLDAGSSLPLLFPLVVVANHLDVFSIRYANPVGVDQVEVHYAYFCHQDDDAEMVRHRLRQSSNMLGPSGFVSLEDATVFMRIQQALDTEPGETYFLKGYREGADLHRTRQNDEAPNALWWETYRTMLGFERAAV
jgi:anthranilate 1,2-dioxygenase large subunit